ncbi:MAG TPA: amino acid ABC transporter substrate-binding protein [Ktedonobacteraceae bacterium]|nr:amino acid ABC transporter substrate-binding protein [Ktedonobacteraceae bacterium]
MEGFHALCSKAGARSIGLLVVIVFLFYGCGSTAGSSGNQSTTPIKIGISVPLSGDFSADGLATKQGYELWADNVNASGGLLGRKITLDFANDGSDTNQVVTDYQKFIATDHVDLVLGPYSTLLTKPASKEAARYGYAMLEGSGGGPSVFTQGLNNVFDASPPIVSQMNGFVQYILSLPASERPTTAAYETEDDPFTQPMIDQAKAQLQAAGIKTVDYQVYSAETTDFTPVAQRIINSNAQLVVLGSMLPDIIAEIKAFRQQHYNPKAIIASAGPDQGSAFTGPIGGANVAEGIFYPNGWDPSINVPATPNVPGAISNAQFVQDFIKQFGGTAQDISADSPEAYSAAQVLQQAVEKVGSLDNSKLIAYLHSGATFYTVQGRVQFDKTGQNTAGIVYVFQWQGGQVKVVYPPAQAVAQPEYPKPAWP